MSDQTPLPPKPRATIDDLLNLSSDGWKQISEMDENQLAEYLSGVEELEPKISPDAQWRGVKEPKEKKKKAEDDSQEELNLDPDNPIKPTKKKSKKKELFSQEEINNLLEDL